MHTSEPIFLVTFFLGYFASAFVWRSLMVYRRTGVNPFVLSSGDDAYGYVGRAFKVVVIGCAVVVLTIAFSGDASRWLGGYDVVRSKTASVIGWLLLTVSLIWLLIAQTQMGDSWRIGIDAERPTTLVQRGLFAVSRNPIFLAMRINLLGLFLVFPAAATFALLAVGEVLMQVQVRLEEQHLKKIHGTDYMEYASRVRRWL
ncbi:MAG TPA: isoprenylcysteine carboxylmethyltransferase family protein [Burkholderiales bacterium]|nr:isoprenylcysteine carboxylmethyltransferase family protein [Burkholderiales bacterium]